MRALPAVLLALLLLPAPRAARGEEGKPPPPVLAGAWTEPTDAGDRRVVVALFLRAGVEARGVHVALSRTSPKEEPGDYGVFAASSWREARLEPGEVLLLRRALGRESAHVLVCERAFDKDLDVHEMIDGDPPAGTFLFEGVGGETVVDVDRHVAFVGDVVEAMVRPPGDEGFFRAETLEIVRVPRRLALDGDDPDGPAGWVTTTPRDDPHLRRLEGAEGEARIRSHFTNPKCPWAERHVKWMADLWILEYLEPAPLSLALDTATLKAPGRVSDLWRGYGAFTVESIWPNGFGGSSSNLDLPCLLVLPKGTRVRRADL